MEDLLLRRLPELVEIDLDRGAIHAEAYLACLPLWYRDAFAAIACHWSRILALAPHRPEPWMQHLQRAASRLTGPEVDAQDATGVLEWRHPGGRLGDDPSVGLCWARDAYGGLGGTYLCWMPLFRLECPSGAHWTRDLSSITPQGGAALAIIDHVQRRISHEDSP